MSNAGGHFVIDPDDVTRAIFEVRGSEGLECEGIPPDEPSSSEEAARASYLRRWDGPEKLYKPYVYAKAAMVARLDDLADQTPNFAAATSLIKRAMDLAAETKTPLSLPPMLLLGPPGIGKTHYCHLLAAVIGTSMTTIAGNLISDAGELTGTPPGWRGARPGIPARALLSAASASPLLFVDEVEKMGGRWTDKPQDVLLSLLEPENASRFIDQYLGVKMRADTAYWIMTANDIEPLSLPLRDRLLVIDVPDLTPGEREDVVVRMFDQANKGYGDHFEPLGKAAIAVLTDLNARRAKAVLTQAFGFAAAARRTGITPADMMAAARVVTMGGHKTHTMGFRLR